MDDILTAEQAAILSLLRRVEDLERECHGLRRRLALKARMDAPGPEFSLTGMLHSRAAHDRRPRIESQLARVRS